MGRRDSRISGNDATPARIRLDDDARGEFCPHLRHDGRKRGASRRMRGIRDSYLEPLGVVRPLEESLVNLGPIHLALRASAVARAPRNNVNSLDHPLRGRLSSPQKGGHLPMKSLDGC